MKSDRRTFLKTTGIVGGALLTGVAAKTASTPAAAQTGAGGAAKAMTFCTLRHGADYGLGLKTERGRLVVDPYLAVPDHPEIVACGDAAAVPDLTRPGQVTAMTAQHATRQGALAARNVAAALGRGKRRRYKHHDLGFVVELGGLDAAASPLGVPLSGLAATAVTKGYHLLAMPGNRVRVLTDWLLDALLPTQAVQLGLVRGKQVPLEPRQP